MKDIELPNEIMAILTLCGTHSNPRSFMADKLKASHFGDSRTREIYEVTMAMARKRQEMPTFHTLCHADQLSEEARELITESPYPETKTAGDAEQVFEVLERCRQARVILETYEEVMSQMSEDNADPLLTLVLGLEGSPDADGNLSANNAVAAQEVSLLVKDVHGAAQPLDDAGLLAPELGQDLAGAQAPGIGVAVGAVASDGIVLGFHGAHRSHADRLLADDEVQKATDFPHRVALGTGLFHSTNRQHLAKEAKHLVLAGGLEILGVVGFDS